MHFKRNAQSWFVKQYYLALVGQVAINKTCHHNLTCSIGGVVGVLFCFETDSHSVTWNSWKSLCSLDWPQTSSDPPAQLPKWWDDRWESPSLASTDGFQTSQGKDHALVSREQQRQCAPLRMWDGRENPGTGKAFAGNFKAGRMHQMTSSFQQIFFLYRDPLPASHIPFLFQKKSFLLEASQYVYIFTERTVACVFIIKL